MWNEAEGTAEEAVVTLDFDALDGGFLLPGEADPVWAGDIDRLFVSLVAPDYDMSEVVLATPAEGWAEMSRIACTGSGAVLRSARRCGPGMGWERSEGHTSELQSLRRTPSGVLFFVKKSLHAEHAHSV